jgi:hypothetical protein
MARCIKCKDHKEQIFTGQVYYGKGESLDRGNIFGSFRCNICKDCLYERINNLRKQTLIGTITSFVLLFFLIYARLLLDDAIFFSGTYDFFILIALIFILIFFGVFLSTFIQYYVRLKVQDEADDYLRFLTFKGFKSMGYDSLILPKSIGTEIVIDADLDEIPVDFIDRLPPSELVIKDKFTSKLSWIFAIISIIVIVFIGYWFANNPIIIEEDYYSTTILLPIVPFIIIIGIILGIAYLFEKIKK